MSLSTLDNYKPEILSGPFGSLLAAQHISTRQAFADERHDLILDALRQYRESGVTQPVTPTFGAAARGVYGGEFTNELREWNLAAASMTQSTFPGAEPYGSVAPLLDTSGTNDLAWAQRMHHVDAARRIHVPQFTALRDGKISRVLAEAVHDTHEAAGLVLAARETGMQEIVVSFEPTKNGLPNHANGFGSYGDVQDYLHELGGGDMNVGLGLNCGNAAQISTIVGDENPRTFRAIYPNKAGIPHGEDGDLFRYLADRNEKRTHDEQREFDDLCRIYDVSSQLQRLILLCEAKGVENIGLCCGATPDDIRAIRQALTTHSASRRSPLVA